MDDLPALYRQLTTKLNGVLGKKVSAQARADVLAKLRAYDWPANIRQLESVLGRAIAGARANVLTPSTIDFEPEGGTGEGSAAGGGSVDRAERAARGELSWEEIKLVHGEFRQRALIAFLRGFRPARAGTRLADLRRARDKGHNVRQVLREFAAWENWAAVEDARPNS